MKKIHQFYEINASVKDVFDALTKPSIIKIWSASNATMSAKKGGEFSLWGGEMFGKNLEVVKNKKLVQEWCTKSFTSLVTFNLKEKGTKTEVELIHEGVPEKEIKNYSKGWQNYYLGAIKEMFEVD